MSLDLFRLAPRVGRQRGLGHECAAPQRALPPSIGPGPSPDDEDVRAAALSTPRTYKGPITLSMASAFKTASRTTPRSNDMATATPSPRWRTSPWTAFSAAPAILFKGGPAPTRYPVGVFSSTPRLIHPSTASDDLRAESWPQPRSSPKRRVPRRFTPPRDAEPPVRTALPVPCAVIPIARRRMRAGAHGVRPWNVRRCGRMAHRWQLDVLGALAIHSRSRSSWSAACLARTDTALDRPQRPPERAGCRWPGRTTGALLWRAARCLERLSTRQAPCRRRRHRRGLSEQRRMFGGGSSGGRHAVAGGRRGRRQSRVRRHCCGRAHPRCGVRCKAHRLASRNERACARSWCRFDGHRLGCIVMVVESGPHALRWGPGV